MKYISLFFLFTLGIGSSFGQEQLSLKAFEALCDSTGLTFEMPEGYRSTEVKENRDLGYVFAIVNEDASMEIRYTLWSLKPYVAQYEASLKDSTTVMVPPNTIYQGRIQANVLNMTGGQMADIGPFPPQAVKREFNADAGGSSFFEFNCEFGEGYTYGQFVYLHKDNVADVVITYMSNDLNTHSDLMMAGFHALRFKQ
jgi:hypothetical protein